MIKKHEGTNEVGRWTDFEIDGVRQAVSVSQRVSAVDSRWQKPEVSWKSFAATNTKSLDEFIEALSEARQIALDWDAKTGTEEKLVAGN